MVVILLITKMQLNQEYDIVIIGAGPAGSTTARYAAKGGLKVLLVDKRQELGAPVQCSGAVSRHGLLDAEVEPDDEFVQEKVYGFIIYNSSGETTTHDYRQIKPDDYGSGPGKNPLGYVVDRRRFDRYLMTQAERAGADVWLKTEGLGYQPEMNGKCSVFLRNFNTSITVRCRVLVGADGLQSQVGKWAGIATHIKLKDLASCLQFVVDGVETSGLLEIITGNRWAPGGYAWVFPKGDGYAEIGLGVIRNLTPVNAHQHLLGFMKNSFLKDRFQNSRILEIQGGGVPLAPALKQQFAENMILVGDAARHVNPITGGGIHTALSGGKIAGEFLSLLIRSGKPANMVNLQGYQQLWMQRTGEKMWELYKIKKDFIKTKTEEERDKKLYSTLSNYFSPFSEFKKV